MAGKPIWAILGGIISLAIAYPGLTVAAVIGLVAWLSLLGGLVSLTVAFGVRAIGRGTDPD
ncbi:MAG TPA: hypothetical protein VGQ29_11295 [Gemmatimonadales bacterium]|jgi:hypothetical protein|nr:hypothetical protein [Gemmatimonadales bacterium]